MSTPLVSIIVPVYNMASYIHEALDSAVSQTYDNLEIILVDDGSTDGSGDICNEYACKDKRVFVIHKENGGVSSARNAGLDIMHGDMVAFLDADDIYHPEYIRCMMDAMIRDNCDIVICKYFFFRTYKTDTFEKLLARHPLLDAGVLDRVEILRNLARNEFTGGFWNMLYKSDIWDGIRCPDGRNYEDATIIYRLFNACTTVTIIDSGLYYHRNHSGSLTHTISWKNIEDRMLAVSQFDTYVEANTPGIFTPKDIAIRRQSCLNALMLQYSCYKPSSGCPDRNSFRQMIIKKGTETDKSNYSLRTRTAFWFLCKCPAVLRIAYPIYIRLRSLTKEYIG